MQIAGGAWIFLAVILVWLIGTVYSLYTRTGSGINQRPYGDPYSGQSGAHGPSVLNHDESAATRYTRGTR